MAKIDAVFEGGGVKGIALVGAVSAIEQAGYEFECLAGTSAGAITAALLAVGYTAAEIQTELNELDYTQLKDESRIDRFGFLGKGVSIGLEYGIYEGNFFEQWFEGLLRAKGKTTFGDIEFSDYTHSRYQYRLQVIATDLTDRRLLVLPHALKDFGLDPRSFSITKAVRMSMSIPVFFEPVQLIDRQGHAHIIVDGGVLSNYPIWLLDDGTCNPPWPTFGFKLIEKKTYCLQPPDRNPLSNAWNFLSALAGTLLDAHDNYHISETRGDYARTIPIPTVVECGGEEKQIRATQFELSRKESDALFANGINAARQFLRNWDFAEWTQTYRASNR